MSLLWKVAVEHVKSLPVEDGLYWRLHHKGRDFGPHDATSESFHKPDDYWHDGEGDGDDEETQHMREHFAPRPGYSAYANPHHVHQYAEERNLMTHAGEVIGFHGKQVGYGHDDEPLVMPHSDQVAHRMSYHEFQQRLPHTPKPAQDLDLDEHDGDDWFGGDH